MDKKPNPKRTKTLNTQDAKRLVLILAISATLGFWVLFSNKARQDATSAAASKDPTTTDVPPAESQNQIVLDLPPMPTLVPTLDPSANASLVVQPAPQQNTVSLPEPQPIITTGKILLGGAKPQAKKSSSTTVVTVTRSSRP